MKTPYRRVLLYTLRTAIAITGLAVSCLPGAFAATSAATPATNSASLKLHVPSPDWRDQIIYFLVTDRFNDGDPANNDLGAGEYDPTSNAKYNGGDLKGVEQKLDYIKGLGATAIWITPPVANQWWDPQVQFSGFHGYWAENFMAVDRHLGTLGDYQRLSHTIHSNGMYLVQDIVVNHTGNFFSYQGSWDARDPAKHFALNPGSQPVQAPSQWPFSLNDVRNPDHRRAGIYHWTPNVIDFSDPRQEMNFQMSGLDDINTENPLVRQVLRESYGYWIKEVGVDAYRVDTAFYVPASYFADFMYSREPRHPGMANVARSTGRNDFHVFGEGFGIDKPFSDTYARKIDRYMTSPKGQPLLPGMINFPLYGAMGDVFARGRPTAELAHRIVRMMTLHKRPHLMPTFVDNHDVDRFLAGSTQAALKQSLLMMMTLPGIPTIYYGTEQAFTEPRAAMFKAGFQSGGRDRFDTDTPLYRFIAEISELRKTHRLFSRGKPTILKDNAATAGALAYRMSYGDDAAIVALNSSVGETLLDNMETRLPAGTVLQGVFGIDGTPANLIVGEGGHVSLKLGPRSGLVWKVSRQKVPVPLSLMSITMATLKNLSVRGDFTVSGRAHGVTNFKLVTDGDIASAPTITPASDGHWVATVDTRKMLNANIQHSVVAWADTAPGATNVTSATRTFSVVREWLPLAVVADPEGDDTGPRGTYRYPSDPSWENSHTLDIRRIKVSGADGALKIDVTMKQISTTWNPQNGFDHVAFTLFVEIPGKDGGATVMPLQYRDLPAGMRWHYRLRVHGWSNAMFSAEGASSTNEGSSVTPAADIHVDKANNTVTFILAAGALGNPASLSGAKLYLTTWDFDSGYRQLALTADQGRFGGGDPLTDPRVMDDTPVIVLP